MTTYALIVLAIIAILGFTVFFGAPYVPAKKRDLKTAFDELYKIKASDLILDLGSGDGRVLREVSRRGGRAVGYELHPLLALVSKALSRNDSKVRTEMGNFWKKQFPKDTTLVYLFGDGRDIVKMTQMIEKEVQRIKRPLHVISYGFELPGYHAKKTAGAHLLYELKPLQPVKA